MPDRCNTGHGVLYWARTRHHFLNNLLLGEQLHNARRNASCNASRYVDRLASILDGFTAGCLHARGAHRILTATMFSFCNDACWFYRTTDRHVPKLLRQDLCLAAVPPCGGTAADLPGSGLRLVCFADTPLHTSTVCCSEAILVSAYVTLLQDQVANCLGTLSLLNTICRCCPFIPHIWEAQTWFKGQCMRVGFESTYTINVLRRMLTLPIRPHLPDFYIVGFPVSQCLRSIC